jgi:hypothetical protein
MQKAVFTLNEKGFNQEPGFSPNSNKFGNFGPSKVKLTFTFIDRLNTDQKIFELAESDNVT